MLEVEKLEKTFVSGVLRKQTVHAVRGVSFIIPDRHTFGIVGNSGCGKSTIARILLSLTKPDSGSVRIDGGDILNANRQTGKDLTRKIQIIFQHPENSLDPSKKIHASLLEPMVIHGMYTKAGREERVRELLDLVDLRENLLDRYPHQLSGGEAQRIMIARALTLDPRILILDEPTSMLDVSVQAQVMTLLRELRERLDLSYLFISHDISMVRWFCDEIAVMQDGRFLEQGRTEEILTNPAEAFTKELLASYSFE